MQKNYETELPEGYREAFCVDAKSKKTAILLNTAAVLVTVAGIAAAALIYRPPLRMVVSWRYIAAFGVFLAYIVLHELTHGAAYKLMTKRKLTFGITLSVAFCGVPDIYVYRKTALIALLAPFVTFSIVFGAGAFLLPLAVDRFFTAAVFFCHLGGCAGDLYDTFLYLTRFKDPKVLMRDTGPKQTFYTVGQ